MERLKPPDLHYLSAAVGWLELGCLADAQAELELVSPEHLRHPDVLEVKWLILAKEQQWAAASDVAHKLILEAPERASGWLHQAYAVRRAPEGGLAKAREALLPAAEKFPEEPIVFYNLSCYACQLGQLEEARRWFDKALVSGDKPRLKLMALDDPDLELLWEEIRKL